MPVFRRERGIRGFVNIVGGKPEAFFDLVDAPHLIVLYSIKL